MKYIINNKKSYNLTIIITILIILLVIIYFNINYFLSSEDNIDNFDNLIINNLPITNGLIGAYTSDSFQNNKWKDLSGNGNDAIATGIITQNDNYLTGTINSSLEFPKTILPENYTLIYIAKYDGDNKGRIFSGIGSDWLSGFWDGNVGVAYHNNWLSISSNLPNDWILSTDQNNLYRANLDNFTTGIADGTTNLSVNSNNDTNSSKSDWAISCIFVYNRKLPLNEIELVENFLVNKYSSLLKNISTHDPIVYKDEFINLSSLINHNVYPEDDDNKNLALSPNIINKIDKYFDVNKTNKILNIQMNDDIELLLVNGKFRLRVNLPFMPPHINNQIFNNGINPNYFYLGVVKLDSNCNIYSDIQCKNLYIDNKDCTNKVLSKNIENSYRLVLIPGLYALDDTLSFNNIDFTLTKIDGLTYLMNVNTGYLPKLFLNDKSLNLHGNMLNDSNSNITKIYDEINNKICNETKNNLDISQDILNVSCLYKQDPKLYLLTTTDVNTSSPVSITINNNNTININLNKYDLYGNLSDTLMLSSCNYNLTTSEYIEKVTAKNLGKVSINLVCLNSSNSLNSKLNNKLDFTVELIDYPEESIIKSSIQTI